MRNRMAGPENNSFLELFSKYCYDTSFNNIDKLEKHLLEMQKKICDTPLSMMEHCSKTYCTVCKVEFPSSSFFFFLFSLFSPSLSLHLLGCRRIN